MDPISAAIVTSLATGVGEVGRKLILDTYEALKGAMKKKYGADSDLVKAVVKLENKPDSAGRQETLQNEVQAAKVAHDIELRRLAESLLKAVKDTPDGCAIMKKYNIDAEKIGVVGDQAHIEGGQHF